MKIISTPSNTIPVSDMKNGQIAIIRAWPVSLYIGNVVQKNEDRIIELGSENHWNIDSCMTNEKLFQVEILLPGTQLEI